MSFIRLLYYELRLGMLRARYLAVLPAGMLLAWDYRRAMGLGGAWDCLAYVMLGAEPGARLGLPAAWLLALSACLLPNLGFGALENTQLLVRAGRVWGWFVKCLWSLAAAVQCALVLYAGMALALPGRPLYSVTAQPEYLLLALAATAALNLLQTLLAACLGPAPAFLAVLAVLAASVYFCSPLLIGNWAMLLRSRELGLTPGFAVCLAVWMLTAAAGAAMMRRRDLMRGLRQ